MCRRRAPALLAALLACASLVYSPVVEARGERIKKPKKPKGPPKPERIEVGALPALSYDSDLGLGFGLIASVARFSPGYRPYRWRLELLLSANAKRAPGKGIEVPFHDDYLNMDFPGLAGDRLRITARVGFRKFANTGYYGFGNDSVATEPWEGLDPDQDLMAYQAARRYHRFDHIYPLLLFNARIKVWDRSTPQQRRRIEALVGLNTTYNIVRPYPGSLLEQDIALKAMDTPDGQATAHLLQGTDPHMLMVVSAGALFDTRDHEYTPTRGTFTELTVRASPGVQQGLRYAAFTLNSAWFKSFIGEYLSFAVRGVADVIAGDAPFYELTRFGALMPRDGPGGGWSLRGVPRQRYAGKIKLMQNLELRSMFWKFRIKNSQFAVGAVAFLDAARIWADFGRTELGGRSIDGGTFKLGTGGGLRVRWGETFLVRFDAAYSPTDKSNGFYVDVGHVF
ncbi:Omp85 family outer membrane protein [Nannocystis pusilla]|uniref:Outer membrane protein assembly factor n=1 Tax=Nannocystis pusilla TaxID=889268 RepID=A0ABS7TWT8_9BACT|nr:BamA/TamA family outer membrane protein [Nannocystis pusilla]MBZ5712723.1 outer membrane protein assembly factor [Nannocystis pusilla]